MGSKTRKRLRWRNKKPGAKSAARVRLKECESKIMVDAEALSQVVGLLARWALRRGGKVLAEAGVKLENLVSGSRIKGYGDNSESN